ncbi:hypothetical protein M0802_011029 [Mischocyttarus mexicanus]|nr:hypothetical protein M0802_011029 [Mischocyttarus mexicanus]
MIVIFSFVFWVRFIKIKFSQLNNILKKMLKTTVNSPQHKKVFQMKDMYNWEHDPSLITIYRTYEANENCKKLKKIKQIHLELIKCAKIINEAYGLQILLSAAWSVIFITTLLHNFYPVLLENKYHNWIHNFTSQLALNPLTFTACGFFDLNHTFIYSAIGSITTYLVILIQVGDKPKEFYNNTNYNSTSMTI